MKPSPPTAPSAPNTVEAPRGTVSTRAAFLREFIKAPGVVAAVAPSSAALGRAMIAGIDFSKASAVVEFGPGTGTFTRAVLGALPPKWLVSQGGRGRLIAIEYNGPIAEICRQNFPQITLKHDTAANVIKICADEGLGVDGRGGVDYVVSGLGWPSFSDELRTTMLEGAAAVLRPGGEFRTFGYHVGLLMRGAWHFRREVRRLFKTVEIGRVVWGNLPPAFVYRCVK
jgi:phosphatidylethanolamine/phosphatidyl-N-methylethanolamine N-methyltransferase